MVILGNSPSLYFIRHNRDARYLNIHLSQLDDVTNSRAVAGSLAEN
jgi:hypothetical protein